MALTSGTRLGPYEIQSPLGAGGMGEVYKARDTRLDRTVALKILNSSLTADADVKARFQREARAISQLNHPHICTLHDIGIENGTDFLVMELLEGETLAARLHRGALPLDQVLKVGIQIADALDKAHRAGIVHRDLKPSNIMMTKVGAKLLDFGLAKPAALAASLGAAPLVSAAVTMDAVSPQLSPLTTQGTILGTVQYMSPEQIEGKEVDVRSDLFSFGSILYEMTSGKPAFSGKSQLSVASAILEREPEPITALRPASPPILDYVIRTCLAKDPGQRYQSALDIQLQLTWIGQNNEDAAVAHPAKNSRWWAAGALCIAVSAIAWWLGSRSFKPETIPMQLTTPAPPEIISETFFSPGTISPDGRWLVYVVRHEGRQQLYVRALGETDGKLMPGTEGAAWPFFSPDSQWIAFAAHGVLKKLPISGGAPVDLCNVSLMQGQTEFAGGDWGPDGRIVFVPNFNAGLWEVPAEGGTPKLLLNTDIQNALATPVLDRVAAMHPQVLPNRRGILFTSSPDKAKTSDDEDIAVLATGETTPRILIQGGSNARYLPTGHLIYGHGGTLFAVPFNLAHLKVEGAAVAMVHGLEHGFEDPIYWVSDNGTLVYLAGRPQHFQRLYIFDRKGTGHPITNEAMSPEELAVSPDGKSVVARVSAVNDDLWTFDVSRGTALRLTFEPGDEIYPQWTPDGRRIAYGTRTGTIYWRPADGGGQREELSRGENARYPSSFSPDGKWLEFVEETLTQGRDIWLMPLSGDRKPQPFQVTDADEWSPKFAPNGRWIAYVSNESGTNEIYLRPSGAPGTRKRITSNGGEWPIWSRNGRELFFLRGVALMSVSIDAQGNESPGERVVIDTKKLGDLQLVGTDENPMYDVLPDGQHFVISLSQASAVPSQFNVIVNWFDEIKRLAPN